MNNTQISKVVIKGNIIKFLIDLIISKSIESDGKINNFGKTLIGIIGSLILMFFFMLGYSFLYGIYFGNGSNHISILDIGLNIVPMDTKFVVSIGILILILTCIFILPIKNLFFKKNLFIKVMSIVEIAFCIFVSLNAFKLMLIGQVNFSYNDIYMILIPIFIPLIIFSAAYITKCLNTKIGRLILVISLIVTIIIFLITIKFFKKIDIEITSLLFMPIVSIIANIIDLVLLERLELVELKLQQILKSVKNRVQKVMKSILHKKNTIHTLDKKNSYTIYDFIEICIISVICMAIMLVVSTPNLYASLGSYYGTNYFNNNKQVITYLQDNVQKQKIGNIVGCKDGNYYISEYPNKNLVILKSTQVVAETHVIGWYNINNQWYYFDSYGAMIYDTTTPDGYKVDKMGAWIR